MKPATPTLTPASTAAQAATLQSGVVTRKPVYRNPKRVPSSVPAARRIQAVMAVSAGRSIHQESADVPCAALVVIEEWLRSLERQISELRSELRGRRAA